MNTIGGISYDLDQVIKLVQAACCLTKKCLKSCFSDLSFDKAAASFFFYITFSLGDY